MKNYMDLNLFLNHHLVHRQALHQRRSAFNYLIIQIKRPFKISRRENMSVEIVIDDHSIVPYGTKDTLFCIYSTDPVCTGFLTEQGNKI